MTYNRTSLTRILIKLALVLLLPFTALADNTITDYSAQSLPILNDSLKSTDGRLNIIESAFGNGSVLTVPSGGTGLTIGADDNVMVGNGTTWDSKTLPNCVDSAGNHLNYTASSNAFSCGTSGDGNNGNVVFEHNAHTDVSPGTGVGWGNYSDLSGTGTTAYEYVGVRSANPTYATAWSTKWTKIPGVNTVTVYLQCWQQGPSTNREHSIKINIGTANNTAINLTETTPTWKTIAVDVSGLSNGTNYDVTVQFYTNTDSSNSTFLGELIAFGS